jgi:DNA-binding NtrC family response regulator
MHRYPEPSATDDFMKRFTRALKATDGNKVQAAALLRISRKKLYAKIEKYRL